jgi:hypothetical protein
MAYDESKLARLKHLKELAQKVNDDCATKAELNTLSERVEGLVTAGGEPNVITAIKVNGAAQQVGADKSVDIAVPGYTIEKAADSGDYASVYQLMKDGVATGAAINIPKDMVVQSGSVVTLDADGAAAVGLTKAGTYIKLVLANATSDTLYIDVSGLIEYVTSGSAEGDMVFITIDEATHKVTATITDGTITKAKLAAALVTEIEGKVDKVEGKGLSTNDYTDAEKTKLAGVAEGATKVEASTTEGNIKVNGAEVQVVSIATDAEVTEMLNEVFAAEQPTT